MAVSFRSIIDLDRSDHHAVHPANTANALGIVGTIDPTATACPAILILI